MPEPLRLPVQATFASLLAQEDTDRDRQITVKDTGPRRFELREEGGTCVVLGTYALSNLLQELALAREAGQEELELDPARLDEYLVRRISAGFANTSGRADAADRRVRARPHRGGHQGSRSSPAPLRACERSAGLGVLHRGRP